MTAVGFIPISVATLAPSSSIGVDLYLMSSGGAAPALYRHAEYPMGEDDLERLRERGIQTLLITDAAQTNYQAYLRRLIDGEGSNCREPMSLRMAAMNAVIRDVLRTAFRRGDDEATVQSAFELGEVTGRIVSHDDFNAQEMFRLLYHDYATFTHVTNVSLYATMLGSALGMPQDDLNRLATGALLHDLGKLQIDDRVLCKPGRLDEFEMRQIRLHPTFGFRRLVHRTDLDFGQLMMVYQHHERLDGKGYPVGCVAEEIHDWAKICAIVDVYEALTSNRPYRRSMSRADAIAILERESGLAFDPEMLKCWIEITRR